jgi:hypothetical protein
LTRIYWIGKDFWSKSNKTVTQGFFDDGRSPGTPVKGIRSQLNGFQQVQDWLWPGQPHREFPASMEGIRDLMNALTYVKGWKEVLVYSLQDIEDIFLGGRAWMVWLVEVARLGGTVYSVVNVLDKSIQYEDMTKLAEADREALATPPDPDTVDEFDAWFGRRKRRLSKKKKANTTT